MQQLNVLSINVSQGVETKDDSSALISSTSKDDFSQHIDLHVAKNKDVSGKTNKAIDDSFEVKKDNLSGSQKKLKSAEKTEEQSNSPIGSAGEKSSATDAQEVAASQPKKEIETGKSGADEESTTSDESELLMSFLTKADQTLIEGNSIGGSLADKIKQNDMSAEQKAKHEAQLLLKSSDKVADLSDVAKAVSSNKDIVLEDLVEQDKSIKSLLASAKTVTEHADTNQAIIIKSPIEDSSQKLQSLAIDELTQKNVDKLDKESSLSQQLNADKLSGSITDSDAINNKKATELAQNNSVHQVVKNDLDTQVLNKMNVESESLAQKAKEQHTVMPVNDTKASIKTIENSQTVNKNQSLFESESKINEQITKLIQSESSTSKAEYDSKSMISAMQHSTSQNKNKNVAATNLGKIEAEPLAEEHGFIEAEAKLNAKAIEAQIDQSKGLSAGDNKEKISKPQSQVGTNFSLKGSYIDTPDKAIQTAYDRVEQQSAEIFNPTNSAEVSQSQKTNTQLHHETISIFRKDFADAVKDKVMLMVSQKLQQFDITLDPPELGNMQVRVNLQGEQATVNFVVQNQQIKDSLEQNMHKLRDLLAEQGVDVGDANVEQQSQQSDKEENTDDSQHNLMKNTVDASDAVAHHLSANINNLSSTAIDYYA